MPGAFSEPIVRRAPFLLTIFTVLALFINLLAGLFGMNVGGASRRPRRVTWQAYDEGATRPRRRNDTCCPSA